jgi:20S proteasome alpha/beta subunit
VLRAPFRISSQRGADRASDDGIPEFDTSALREQSVADNFENFFSDWASRSSSDASNVAATIPSVAATVPSVSVDSRPASSGVETAPPVTIAEGASAEIADASGQSVTFTGTTGTLKLDHSLAFTGQVVGLAGSDAIDLADVNYGVQTQVTFLGNATGGTLTITDGVHTANIALQGDYLSSTWTLSSDGNGGTMVVDPVAANNWQNLKVGSGGFVTGIDISNNGTKVVRTDTNGAYIWNGTQWQQLVTSTSMPASIVGSGTGTGVYEIQVAANNPNVMYMAYEGYVFSSTNGGTTWTQTSFAQVNESSNDEQRMNGQKMAIDPNNPNVVYVGTPQNGMFVSTNGGATWQSVSAVPVSGTNSNGEYPGITGILFDPSSGVTGGKTNTIYASSYGNGVYKSTNGGASWSRLSGGPTDVEYAAISSTGVYYAVSTGNTDLWRYANGAWTELLNNPNWGIQSVAVDPSNPNHVVYLTASGMFNQSFDGGTTWSGLFNQVEVSTDIPWLAYANGGTWMTIGGTAFDPSTGQLVTTSGTGVWTATVPAAGTSPTNIVYNDQSAGIDQLVANDIIVPTSGHPVLANWDFGFFYVTDPNSYPTSHGPTTDFAAGWSLDYASSNPSFVVGISDWGGTETSGYSTDGGQTWTRFASVAPTANGTYMGGTIAASTTQNFIWAPAGATQPFYTLDGGVSWHAITLPGVTSWDGFEPSSYLTTRVVTADRVQANTFYLYFPGDASQGQGSGVYKTTNGGQTWTQVYSGLITDWSYWNNELESVPGQAGNLFFTGGIQGTFNAASPDTNEAFKRSTDGGVTWTTVPNVLEVLTFGFGAAAPGQTYPSIYIVGWVNNVYGIWQSSNNAQSWTQIGTYPGGNLDQITTISGDPGIYGQVYVGFSGGGYAYLSAASTGSTGPAVTGVTASPATGDLNAGNTVTLTLNLSSAVTVAGGTPTLTLNDGGTATYTGGSGTGALTFSYTVGAGQNTADLTVTAVNLGAATVKDSSGNAADLSGAVTNPSGTLQIDTTAPSVSSVAASGTGITAGAGDLAAGKTVTLTLNFGEAVTVAGGTPTLTLNDGGIAIYTGGSGTGALTFSYTVAAGQNTSDLTVTAINLNSATVKDGAGNAADLSGAVTNPTGTLQIDTTAPTVSSLVASGTGITAGAGDLAAGKTVTLTLNLSEAATVAGGTPTLTLNDGGTATYSGGSGTSALTFSYTVAAGQNTADLTVTAVNLGTATVNDGAGNAANLSGAVTNPAGTLQIDTTAPTVSSVAASGTGITAGTGNLTTGSVVTLTLNLSEAVTVAGGTPTLSLNDGGTATYTGGSGTGALTFSYTVAAGQNTADLAVTAVNLNSATVKDGAGNAANLSGAVTNPAGTLQIDTGAPTVSSVVASGTGITAGAGDLAAGATVTLTLNLSEAVTVTGGTPTLTLNDGGTAIYTGGSGTGALTFSYTVAAGQNTADLAVTAVNLNSAAVKDGAGNAANLSGAVTSPAGTLQIDTTAPTVSSLVASGTGITAGAGDLAAGKIVTLTLNLSEAVTVAGGTPTLTLNDGGTATYTGGSGTGALTFSYTVAAGQNTADLAVTAVNLNSATVKDGAGNVANLSGAVANPAGTLQIDTTTPTVTQIVASPGTGTVFPGDTVTMTVTFGEAVKVTGAPTFSLNDGGTATYTGGSGTNTLTFSYTVAPTDVTLPQLAITQANLPNGATIKDGAGNAANLSGAVTTFTTLAIDPPPPIEANGTTSLAQFGSNYFLDPIAGGSGVELKYSGSPVTAGEFGAWTFIAAEQISGGYEVALHLPGSDQYTVWNTDSSGNVVSNATGGVVSGTSNALESLEASFHQDLNGDGTIGVAAVPGTVIEALGSTSLVQVGSNYFFNPVAGGTGPELKYGGSPVTVGGFGAWTFIAAEQTGSGYEVALHLPGSNQYTVWNTDSSGNVVSNATGGVVSGTSNALESLEASFHQDLNGDGTIGVAAVPGTVIEALGSTSLVQVGSNYFLNPVAGGTGPELKYSGSPVTAGEFGAWTFIGAEQISGGYEVALHLPGNDQYTVWNTDSSGNVVSNATGGVVSGTSNALESLEASFHQDLNGDGTIGVATVPGTVIEALGSTSLVQVGSNYFLNPVAGGTGPELKYSGAPVTAGEFGAWTFIAAEQTGGGYEVALHLPGSDQYTVWNTDSSGNVVSNATGGVVSGTSNALQSLEASFQQDLNGDGVIVIAAGQTMELTGAYSGTIKFGGATGTLKVDHAASFTGTIGGQLAIGDVIDFADITAGAGATIGYSGNNSSGTLTVSDGVHTASLALTGNYSLANFTASSDGHGGTSVVDPPLPTDQSGSSLSDYLPNDPVNSALNQQLALWSQHMASAFPSSAFGNDASSGHSEWGFHQLPQLAQPAANQQHI